MPKIVSYKPAEPKDGCFIKSLVITGGMNDGERWDSYDVTFSDGTTRTLMKREGYDGFYREVMVPWDFKHPKIAHG